MGTALCLWLGVNEDSEGETTSKVKSSKRKALNWDIYKQALLNATGVSGVSPLVAGTGETGEMRMMPGEAQGSRAVLGSEAGGGRESQNHRMVWVGRELRGNPVPIPPPWVGIPSTRPGC